MDSSHVTHIHKSSVTPCVTHTTKETEKNKHGAPKNKNTSFPVNLISGVEIVSFYCYSNLSYLLPPLTVTVSVCERNVCALRRTIRFQFMA
jgi:hypothetical protein